VRTKLLMTFFVYILYSKRCNTFYKGQTSNLELRLKRHNNGLVKSTSRYKPWKLIWATEKATRKEAINLEKKLKNLSREKLKEFINKYPWRSWRLVIPKSGCWPRRQHSNPLVRTFQVTYCFKRLHESFCSVKKRSFELRTKLCDMVPSKKDLCR